MGLSFPSAVPSVDEEKAPRNPRSPGTCTKNCPSGHPPESRTCVTLAAPQLSPRVVVEIAGRASYPESHPDGGKNGWDSRRFPREKMCYFAQYAAAIAAIFLSWLPLLCPIRAGKPTTRNALDSGAEEASWIARRVWPLVRKAPETSSFLRRARKPAPASSACIHDVLCRVSQLWRRHPAGS